MLVTVARRKGASAIPTGGCHGLWFDCRIFTLHVFLFFPRLYHCFLLKGFFIIIIIILVHVSPYSKVNLLNTGDVKKICFFALTSLKHLGVKPGLASTDNLLM